jgi:hypothetical protein
MLNRSTGKPIERHQRRHVVGQFHQPLEASAAGDVGACQDPGLQEAEQHRQNGRDAGNQQRVPQHAGVVDQVGVIVEAVFLGRKRRRIADVE